MGRGIVGIHQIEQSSCGSSNRCNPMSIILWIHIFNLIAQLGSSLKQSRDSWTAQPIGTDRQSMFCVISLRETLRLTIDDQADAVLLPKLHSLDLVGGNMSKSCLLKKTSELLVLRFIDSKFDKVHTYRLVNLWQTPTLRHHLGR